MTDQLMAQLAMLLHHLEDASEHKDSPEVLDVSLDDAESIAEGITNTALPAGKADAVEGALEAGEAAAEKEAAYDLGIDAFCSRCGFDSARRQVFRDIAMNIGMGTVKSAAELVGAIEKQALISDAIGAVVGALRKKDGDESRLDAIGRSAGTGALTGSGATLGAGLGAGTGAASAMSKLREAMGTYEKVPSPVIQKLLGMFKKRLLLGGLVGGTAGGTAAYNTFKRKD